MVSKSEDSYTAELQTVLRIAHALKEATVTSCSPRRSSASEVAPDPVSLPSPQSLFRVSQNSGITPEITSAANQIYLRRAEELRKHIQESIAVAYRKATESPPAAHISPPDLLMKRITSILTDVYSRRLEEWKKEIIQRIRLAMDLPPKAIPKNYHAFNQKYIPLLEHFFEENPFPTHADKMLLANKSNMEYKQIHVWFQNRRNRSKREGKAQRKRTTNQGSAKSLKKPHDCVKTGTVLGSRVPETPKVRSGKTQIPLDDTSKNIFPLSSPPHAFPSPYPPVCHYDPFPCKSGPAHFNKPEWKRSPYGRLPFSLSVNIDELVDKFSRLNVRDEAQCKGSPKLSLFHAATAAITVIPSRAPHPSLLPCDHCQTTNVVQCYPVARSSTPSSKVFQNFSSIPKPVTLVSSSISPDDGSGLPRKTAPLPQRSPNRTCNTRRNTIPSERSTSPPLLPLNFENRNCSSSSIGSLSTSSDT